MGSDKWINLCIQYQEKLCKLRKVSGIQDSEKNCLTPDFPHQDSRLGTQTVFLRILNPKIQDFKDLSLSLSYVLVPSCFYFFLICIIIYNYIIYIYIYTYIYIQVYIYIDITWLIFHPLNVYYLWLSEDFGGTQQHPAGSTTLRAFF